MQSGMYQIHLCVLFSPTFTDFSLQMCKIADSLEIAIAMLLATLTMKKGHFCAFATQALLEMELFVDLSKVVNCCVYPAQ